jgi:transposase-like protein
MTCLYCKGKCVKNGLFCRSKQRYKCSNCNITFSDSTIENDNNKKKIRLVLHLILAGCINRDIASELEMEEKIIKNWRKLYFRKLKKLLPVKPSLTIDRLKGIYERIEKFRPTKFNRSRGPGMRRY